MITFTLIKILFIDFSRVTYTYFTQSTSNLWNGQSNKITVLYRIVSARIVRISASIST